MELTGDQIEALRTGQAVPLIVDETACVIVRRDVFELATKALDGGLPSLAEQRALLTHIGEMAGWNDRDQDIYDEPR